MFNSRTPFKSVPCPAGSKCLLINCIFSHNSVSKAETERAGGDRKRQKLDDHGIKAASKHEPYTGRLAVSPKHGKDVGDEQLRHKQPFVLGGTGRSVKEQGDRTSGAEKTKESPKATASRDSKSTQKESLTPRMVTDQPAAFTVRLALLKLVHDQMARLNDLVTTGSEPAKEEIILSAGEIVKLALDEEEKVAKTQPKVYKTVMGHLVTRLKKMDVNGWVSQRRDQIQAAKEPSGPVKEQDLTGPMPIPLPDVLVTELDLSHELHLLRRYHIDIPHAGGGLTNHGFVLVNPPDAELAETRRALRMSDHWEACDRCGTRFQVFPQRREGDGALTTGGECKYHWAKPYKEKGTKTAIHVCCGQPPGSPGCTTHNTHVFKTSDKKRLALLWEFVMTAGEHEVEDRRSVEPAVSFDCEMAYTTQGLEIIRLSASKWPSGEALIDVLVKPYGHILDLNTRFSGVTPQQFLNAPKWSASKPVLPTSVGLHILPNPPAARSLLFAHITPRTALIGHAMENDLNTMRVIHPTLVDTALLFPHPAGLPYRSALRKLTKEILGLSIQQQTDEVKAGKDGHDSLEDARATGWLVNARVRSDWKKLKSADWKVAPSPEADQMDAKKRLWFIPPTDDTSQIASTIKAGRYTITLNDWWM
jgi:RNA exonuclease 1